MRQEVDDAMQHWTTEMDAMRQGVDDFKVAFRQKYGRDYTPEDADFAQRYGRYPDDPAETYLQAIAAIGPLHSHALCS